MMKVLDSDSGDIAHPRSGDIAESEDGSPLPEMEAGSFFAVLAHFGVITVASGGRPGSCRSNCPNFEEHGVDIQTCTMQPATLIEGATCGFTLEARQSNSAASIVSNRAQIAMCLFDTLHYKSTV